jgi:hypothetical protein
MGKESALTFEAKSSLHGVHGRAAEVSGYIEACLDDDGSLSAEPPPKMHVEFPVERLRSGNSLQDKEMWRLIDSSRFPMIYADLRDITPTGAPGGYTAEGEVTLAGRSRRYTGRMDVRRDGERLVVDGEIVVDIRDYGLRPPQILFMKVDPEVKVRLHLVAANAA